MVVVSAAEVVVVSASVVVVVAGAVLTVVKAMAVEVVALDVVTDAPVSNVPVDVAVASVDPDDPPHAATINVKATRPLNRWRFLECILVVTVPRRACRFRVRECTRAG